MTPGESGRRHYWWLHPSALVFVFLLPTYLLVWYAGYRTDGQISTASGYYFLHGAMAWLGMAGLLVLGIGTLSPIVPARPEAGDSAEAVSPLFLGAIGCIALLGYIYWFKDLIVNPLSVLESILARDDNSLSVRGAIERGAGLASFGQISVAYFALYAHMKLSSFRHLLAGYHHWLFGLLLAAVVFRVFAWSERAALIEAVVALVVVSVVSVDANRLWQRVTIAAAPLFAIGGAVGLFAIGEYFRSWSSHYSKIHDSFWDFIFQRLVNYYFGALNSGAGRLQVLEWPDFQFDWILSWLRKMPILGEHFTTFVGATSDEFLQRFGDPEFTNPSGLFMIFFDVGLLGGFFVLLALGVVSKYLYVRWTINRDLVGLLYLPCVLSLLELFRYIYFGDSRSFMVIGGLLAATLFPFQSAASALRRRAVSTVD